MLERAAGLLPNCGTMHMNLWGIVCLSPSKISGQATLFSGKGSVIVDQGCICHSAERCSRLGT